MLISISLVLILTGIYFGYKSSKILRECIVYSKEKQLKILGSAASSEVIMLSNIFFILKLLKFNREIDTKDTTQRDYLVSSRKELLKAITIMLLSQAIFLGATYAH